MDTENIEPPAFIMELTAKLVVAYVSNNPLPASELPATIAAVSSALGRSHANAAMAPVAERPQPAVPVARSVADDHIVCLEDGKTFKALKRHIMTQHAMTPEAYRERWELAPDYPMVAPAYAQTRSNLAKSIGLGRKPGKTE